MNSSLIDEQAIASSELAEHLEAQIQLIAPIQNHPALQQVRTQMREVVADYAVSVQQLTESITKLGVQLSELLLEAKQRLKPKEYKASLEVADVNPAKARKYVNIATTFKDFAPAHQLGDRLKKVELTTLMSLCTKSKAAVVEKLRSVGDISRREVEQAIKQHRVLRKPELQLNPVTGWKQNFSGGGRHYQIAFYGDQGERVGEIIERSAALQGWLPQRVATHAITFWDNYKDRIEEFSIEIGKLLEMHVRCEKLEIQLGKRDERIVELESQLSSKGSVVEENQEFSSQDAIAQQLLRSATTWEDVCTAVGRDCKYLMRLLEDWSIQQRGVLVNLLANYFLSNPEKIETECWVPKKLFVKAWSEFRHISSSTP